MNKKKILAVIPARGGSKGIKNKNLSMIGGQTIVDIAIKSTIKSNLITQTILSSDSEEILNIGKKYKDIINHKRPKYLSGDKTLIVDVLLNIIKKYKGFEIIVLLQPTSPFRNPKDIDKCLRKMIQKNYKTAISVSELNFDPRWLFQIDTSGKLIPINSRFPSSTNRQEKKNYYKFSGDIYASDINWLKSKKTFVSNNTMSYLITNKKSIDIDNPIDLDIAEIMAKKYS